MKKIYKVILLFSFLFAIFSTQSNGANLKITNSKLAFPSQSGRLKVVGTQLCNQSGNPIQLKGISTHGLSWYPKYVNQTCFRQLRYQWGVNCIRLAMYTAEYNGYCVAGATNQNRLKRVIDDGVQFATANDMYVIIDWHVLNDKNPNKYKKQAKVFFEEMAEKYKNNNNVIYEICNEPNGETTWTSIKTYASEIISVIRAHDPNAIIIVGTPTWSQSVDQAAASPLQGVSNIMYALHFYAGTHKASLRNRMEAAIQNGLPIFVSEYGICNASGRGSLNKKEAKKWINLMDKYNISYIAWNLSNKKESCAILKPGFKKANSFAYKNLSNYGKWLYNTLRKSATK